MVHVNINVSDFDRSRTFYEALGFKLVWRVPPTNSVEVAAAVGMQPYRVKGGLMALEGAAHPVVIDLLEWETPKDTAPPYTAVPPPAMSVNIAVGSNSPITGVTRITVRAARTEIESARVSGMVPVASRNAAQRRDGEAACNSTAVPRQGLPYRVFRNCTGIALPQEFRCFFKRCTGDQYCAGERRAEQERQ
eukprot:gene55818-76504_t